MGLTKEQKEIVKDFFERSKSAGAMATARNVYTCWPSEPWKGAVVARPEEAQLRHYVSNNIHRKQVIRPYITPILPHITPLLSAIWPVM